MSQDVVVNGTTYPAVETVAMMDENGNVTMFYPDAVRFNAQTLTEAQKAQARQNIGAQAELTAADQEAIVQQVILALGTPVFGTIDADNNITLSIDHLADGTYKLGYEDKDGNWVEICSLNKEGEPTWTNIIPLTINTDGSPYVGTNGEQGYQSNIRLSSTYTEKAQSGVDTTGYCPAVVSDTFYFYNIDLYADGVKYRKLVTYDSSFTAIAAVVLDDLYEKKDNEYIAPYATFSDDGKLVSINLECVGYWAGTAGKNIAYVRFCTSTITSDSVITKNEPMK